MFIDHVKKVVGGIWSADLRSARQGGFLWLDELSVTPWGEARKLILLLETGVHVPTVPRC